MPNIFLTPTGFKAFIVHFRRQCVGRPQVGTVEYDFLAPSGLTKSYRFRTGDEYLIAVRNSAHHQWRPIAPNEENYNVMGQRPQAINREAIVTAFGTDFDQPYHDWSRELRVICAFTAEAARSHSVYRACQAAIHGHTPLVYSSIWGFINGYDDARIKNGIAPNVFRALDDEDYR